MPITFHTHDLDISKKDWGWKVVWGAPEDVAAERYLMLQRAGRFTEQDVQFGRADIYIECCGQGWSWFGHIVSFELLRDRVRVQLDATAASEMHNDGHVEVSFTLSDARFAELQRALTQIFDGYSYYKTTAA